ncbi:zinc finger protein [Fragilaria crotonensis]|nr:zinc finger protein [Fragilaria crotonensis]
MFRKSKKPTKTLRKRPAQDDEDEDKTTSELLQEARANSNGKKQKSAAVEQDNASSLMQQYKASGAPQLSEKDLATGTAQHHPEAIVEKEKPDDGIFRDTSRNKFLAGPLKATQFVRTTARFDYQPDICKDYKDTGFCGFGDTCIYLHDRGDTLTGWQLEQQWEEQKKKDMALRELDAFADGQQLKEEVDELPEDGLPFACHICRDHFKDPVVTRCAHYFCEKCILGYVRALDKPLCPICNMDTHGVFNQPTKLLSKKRRLLGGSASWKEFGEAQKKSTPSS